MKIFTLPSETPAPEVDYLNYDHLVACAQEDAHKAQVKKHFEDLGYTGKNTGRIYREGVADGYALYMVVEAPRGSTARHKFFLIHLPYVDGYQSRTVGYMSKKGILDIMAATDRLDALFARKAA